MNGLWGGDPRAPCTLQINNSYSSLVSRIMAPRHCHPDIHVLIPRTRDYLIVHDRRGFADRIRLRILRVSWMIKVGPYSSRVPRREFPAWLRGLRTRHSVCEDVSSILGFFAQWVKDPVLLQLWRRSQLWLGFSPGPFSICHR